MDILNSSIKITKKIPFEFHVEDLKPPFNSPRRGEKIPDTTSIQLNLKNFLPLRGRCHVVAKGAF
jgi:hypothetical protein